MSNSSSFVYEEGEVAPPSRPSAGDVVGGKYRLVRLLGLGGMGVVFEAEHLRLRQSVAIKFLKSEVLRLPDAVERFEREARASCRMRGPHVVQVLDVDTDACGRPYMVMELLRGRDLEAELRERGALAITEAVDWVLQACAAVGEAHAAGIIHRDLKPSNLYLATQGERRVVKVLDFGISKVARDEPASASPARPDGVQTLTMTSSAVTIGTPLYMSPEQVRSSRDVDHRSDIWSLGVILYELVAGAPPFQGTTTAAIAAIVCDATPSLRDVRRDVPEKLERVVMTALAKSPADRFPSVEAFGAALVPFASAEGVAGPYSLRPSHHAFEVASSAMQRAPTAPRASDASDLLRLPTSGTGRAAIRSLRHDALRTFAGSMAIGVAVATGVVLGRQGARSASAAPELVPAVREAPEMVQASPERVEPAARPMPHHHRRWAPVRRR